MAKIKASDKWTGEERRAVVLQLTERARLAVIENHTKKVLDCLLYIRMVCERPAENLELNRNELDKAFDQI